MVPAGPPSGAGSRSRPAAGVRARWTGGVVLEDAHGTGRGDLGASLWLSEQANGVASAAPPAAAHIWLASRSALIHAESGDETACWRALERADLALARAAAQEPRHAGFLSDAGWFRDLRQPYWSINQQGLCLLLLNRADGEAMVRLSLSSFPRPSCRSAHLVALAEYEVRLREVDEACRTAAEALSAAREAGATLSMNRIRRLRLRMAGWGEGSALRDLDGRLQACISS